MKKHFSILLILFFSTTTLLFAQRLVQFGGHVGVNASNADAPGVYKDSETKAGYVAGVYARIGHKFFAQPQVDFIKISTQFTEQNAKGETVKALDYTMLNIPLMAGYKIFQSNDEKSNFRLMAGGMYSSILSVKEGESNLKKDSFNSSLFSLGGGFGFDIKFIKIDLLGQIGMNDFYKVPTGTRNRLVTLTVGFKI